MNYPVWQLDSFGGGLWIIIIAVFHVYIAHFAVGGGLFLVLAERKAEREGNASMLDYVRVHAKFFLLLTMVAGSITGVGIWFIIALLNPAATSILIHTFVFAWAMEWVFFLLEIVSLFLYAYTFGRMVGWKHRLLGWIYFVSAWMSLFLINGIIDFMLTPGRWPQDGNFWSGFFNPSFWPSLCFRTFLSLIIAGLFGLVTATWLKERRLRNSMVRFCARWLLLPFVLFVVSAWWYKLALPTELQELIFQRMPSIQPFFEGLLIGSPILVLAGLLLIFRLPPALSRLLALVLLVVGQLYIGCFEFIREGGRRPYIIRDVMYSTSILKKDMDRIQDQGILTLAKWVKHREITPENRLAAGREIYNLLCLSCHAIDGPMRDIKKSAAPYTPSGLDAMISGMHIFHPSMPPFAGTTEERRALAAFIAEELNGRQDPVPVTLQAKEVKIPPFDSESDPYILLVWSPGGMKNVAEVKGVLSLLPPGSELRAQLIKRGEIPEIINQGVLLTYRLDQEKPGNTAKTFSGEMMAEDDYFVAEHIVINPAGGAAFDPYPILQLTAKDESGKLLATTKVVLPVSTEIGCSTCHGTSPELGDRPGLGRGTAFNILAAHDRLSKTRLLQQAQKGTMVQCRECHADSLYKAKGMPELLNLSASIHGFHANYLKEKGAAACGLCHPSSVTGSTRMLRDFHSSIAMDCTSCHGVLEDQALGLLKKEQQGGKGQAQALMLRLAPRAVNSIDAIKPRSPWSQQPDCLHCHVDYQAPETDTLLQSWTADEQGLYRNRTDDSGRLFCGTCHSSPHAVYPADNPYGKQLDVLQPLQYQDNRLPIGSNRNCKLCHTVDMADEMHHANSLRDFRNE
ncbi:MAG: cytochrome ubiquinol oxidase subunit I [Desulfobulbus sp.]